MALDDQEQQPSSSSSSAGPLRSPIRSTTTSLLLSSSQRLTTLESPAVLPRWVPNECANECQGCNAPFTFLNRRHHCRNCGGLFCSACSTQRAKLSGDHQQPLRVCDGCVSAAHVCGSYHAARSHAARKASMSILSQTAARMSSPRSLDSSRNQQQRQGGASAFFGSEPVASSGAAADSHGGPPSPSAAKSLPLHTITAGNKDTDSKGAQQQEGESHDDVAIAGGGGGGPAPPQQQPVVVTSLHGFAELVSLSLRQVAAIGDAEERQGRILQLLQDLDEIETAKAGLLAAFIASQEEQLLGTAMM